jgi:hypothetical protein
MSSSSICNCLLAYISSPDERPSGHIKKAVPLYLGVLQEDERHWVTIIFPWCMSLMLYVCSGRAQDDGDIWPPDSSTEQSTTSLGIIRCSRLACRLHPEFDPVHPFETNINKPRPTLRFVVEPDDYWSVLTSQHGFLIRSESICFCTRMLHIEGAWTLNLSEEAITLFINIDYKATSSNLASFFSYKWRLQICCTWSAIASFS